MPSVKPSGRDWLHYSAVSRRASAKLTSEAKKL